MDSEELEYQDGLNWTEVYTIFIMKLKLTENSACSHFCNTASICPGLFRVCWDSWTSQTTSAYPHWDQEAHCKEADFEILCHISEEKGEVLRSQELQSHTTEKQIEAVGEKFSKITPFSFIMPSKVFY